MVLIHQWQHFPYVLAAVLSSQNVQVEFVCLQFHDNLSHGPFKIQPGHQLSIIFVRKLLLTKLDTHYWLQLVLD